MKRSPRATTIAFASVLLLYLAASGARAEEPAWLAAARAKLPANLVGGQIIQQSGGKATMAVYPAGADSPKTPASAFDPGQVLEVTLKSEGGTLTVAETTVRPRRPDERPKDDTDEEYLAILTKLAKARDAAKGADKAVEPCQIQGWAMDDGKKGLAVRAAPSDKAKVVGRLAPMYVSEESGQSSQEGWRVEFDITGYKDGWFRIANATPPGAPYDDPPPKKYPKTYSGTGWIRVGEAGGAYAFTQMPIQHLMQAPHVDAKDFPPKGEAATPEGNLVIDSGLDKLLACSANWALTQSVDGQRGWWRGICANQATTCS